jgi:hypothetical protein
MLNRALESYDAPVKLAAPPKRPFRTIGVEDVGEEAELRPLDGIPPTEGSRVSALARSLDLDETNRRACYIDLIVRPCPEIGQSDLAISTASTPST